MSPADIPIEIDCQSVHRKLAAREDLLLVDCREQDEWDLVRIPGATLLPMSQLAGRIVEIEPHKDRQVVIHCHHGGRSLQVAQFLRKQGFQGAQSMAGGIDEWSRTIDPSLPRY
jgi:rhodanese-related sulfurtransferase